MTHIELINLLGEGFVLRMTRSNEGWKYGNYSWCYYYSGRDTCADYYHDGEYYTTAIILRDVAFGNIKKEVYLNHYTKEEYELIKLLG